MTEKTPEPWEFALAASQFALQASMASTKKEAIDACLKGIDCASAAVVVAEDRKKK